MPLHINAADLDLIIQVFDRELPDIEVRAFGSRVSDGDSKPDGDLDLVLVGGHSISLERMIAVERSLAEQGFAFAIDVFDYKKLSEKLRDTVNENFVVIKKSSV